MPQLPLITAADLAPWLDGDNFSAQARALIKQQCNSWELANINYNGLKKVKVKSIDFEGFTIKIQFNPERIRSSAAKVDAQSISERKCFLCPEHLPAEQKGLLYDNKYLVLANPFPIFNEHLTLPQLQHTDQLIEKNVGDMLFLARELHDFVVFYNGPQCGASAPDHFHFQAGIKGFMPICEEFNKLNKELLYANGDIQAWATGSHLRKMITLESVNIEAIVHKFKQLLTILNTFQPEKPEPMLNILAAYDKNSWRVHIFPRKLHRPSQFFEKGEKKLLISPASVDFGGVFITPREEDFERITAHDIVDIFEQVCINDEVWNILKEKLRKNITNC